MARCTDGKVQERGFDDPGFHDDKGQVIDFDPRVSMSDNKSGYYELSGKSSAIDASGLLKFMWGKAVLTAGTSIAQFESAGAKAWPRVPPVYTSSTAPAGLRFCTARVRLPFFKHIRPGGSLHALVKRFELGLPVGRHADAPPPDKPGPTGTASAGGLLKGRVVGLIDGGLAFANTSFLQDGKAGGKTRIRHFWRQDGKGAGPAPAALGYGHELTGAAIDAAMKHNTFGGMVDETAVYAGFHTGMELNKQVNHDTHVLPAQRQFQQHRHRPQHRLGQRHPGA